MIPESQPANSLAYNGSGVVAHMSNPFDASECKTALIEQPITVRAWLDAEGIEEFNQPTFCLFNGDALMRAEWPQRMIGQGDIVTFVAMPHKTGGGGGGKNPLSTILTIAIMFAAPYAAAAIAPGLAAGAAATGASLGSQLAFGALKGAIALSGAALVSTLVPSSASAPNVNFGGSAGAVAAASPTYSLSGQSNQARLGQPKPSLYGTQLTYPDLAEPSWQIYQDNEQYTHQVYYVSQGEVQAEELRIAQTQIDNFEEVEYELLGPGEEVTLFETGVSPTPEVTGQEMKGPNQISAPATGYVGPFITGTPGTTTSKIGIDIVAPRGLYYADNTGALTNKTITWDVEVQEIDDDGVPVVAAPWVVIASESETAATTTPQRWSYEYVIGDARYQVRTIRTNNNDTDSRTGHDLRWAGCRAYLNETINWGNCTKLAIRMRATDNLSDQTARQVNGIFTRLLPAWSEEEGWSAPVPTRSIAWAFADVAKAAYGGELTDANIDPPDLKAMDTVWEARGDHFDFVFDQPLVVSDALARVAKCGRSVPIPQSGIWRPVRDEQKTIPSVMYTARNIVKGTFRIRYLLPSEETADAVRVDYFDRRLWKPKSVEYALPDSSADKPAKVTIPGITEEDHALRECEHIARDNRYRRILVTFGTEMEGFIPTYGSMVAVSYPMPRWGQSGGVLEYDAGEKLFTFSEPLNWDATAEDHVINLRANNGSLLGPFSVTQGPKSTQVYLADGESLDGFVPYTGGEAERTTYSYGNEFRDWGRMVRVLGIMPRKTKNGMQIEVTGVVEDDRMWEGGS